MLAGRERALAEIDLAALRANVARLRSGLSAGTLHCAVVKANGYGHGAVEAARAAQQAGSAWLSVATVAEAAELRAAGLRGPVLVMGPMTGSELECAASAEADVVAWSSQFLAAALRARARVHIKVNTGMGRLGVEAAEAHALCRQAADGGRLVGLMSHFATADSDDREFFDLQLSRFASVAREAKTAYPELLCHVANSAATLREPRSHFDMVRTGIAMYGLAPSNDDPARDGLRPALKLSSYLAGVRTVAPGESVGYGRRFVAERPTRIGIVPIGYADGVNRLLSNRGVVLVAGRRCGVAGTISMDQLTVCLPGDWGRPGDEVVFIGPAGETAAGDVEAGAPRLLCEEMARQLDTINYEVVCRVGARAVRRYRDRAAPYPLVRAAE
ncbi:MAG: alanine racemase [Thermoleophilia bacterium]